MEPSPFLKTRFRVRLTDHSECDHWSGGKPYHRGANCPACKIPLLLLWDINCSDPRFGRRKFGPLKRLPLYYCWGCGDSIAYQVIDDKTISIFDDASRRKPDYPYEPYPDFFERRGLQLIEGLPDKIRNLIQKFCDEWDASDDDAIYEPTSKEQSLLTDFFGHSVVLPLDLFHHQFGGKPVLTHWAEEIFRCPNSACDGTVADRLRGRKRAMKFLAGILNDPWGGLPMIEPANEETRKNTNIFVTVQFHICDRCWTVLGCNCCD